MHVYFNNNSFTWGEPLMDLFSKTVSGWGCGASEEQSSAQAQWGTYRWGVGTAPVSTSKTMPCFPLPATSSPAPCSWYQCFPFSLLKLQITNSVLGPSLLAAWLSPSVCREMLIQRHISTWDFKLTHGSWLSSALVEFGLLSYFHYLTQSVH